LHPGYVVVNSIIGEDFRVVQRVLEGTNRHSRGPLGFLTAAISLGQALGD
jgi:hypothetical protein